MTDKRTTNDNGKNGEYVEEELDRAKAKKRNPSSLQNQLFVVLLCVLALFFSLCYVSVLILKNREIIGLVGSFLTDSTLGLLGGTAILIPLLMFCHAIFFKRDYESGAVYYKWIFSVIEVISVSIFVAAVTSGSGASDRETLIENGRRFIGGGLIGGKLAELCRKGIGTAGTIIFAIVFIIVFGMLIFGLTPDIFWEKIKFYAIRSMERRERRKTAERKSKSEKKSQNKNKKSGKQQGGGVQRPHYPVPVQTSASAGKRVRGEIDEDVFNGDDNCGTDDSPDVEPPAPGYDEPLPEEYPPLEETLDPVSVSDEDESWLDGIFPVDSGKKPAKKPSDKNDDEPSERMPAEPKPIKTVKKHVGDLKADEPQAKEPSYKFPPTELLPLGKKPNTAGADEEVTQNSRKIEETLHNFNIDVKVVSVSRGPAVTRYEVAPEPGVRVNSIANRVDDISLGLASTGVRVEGVIPGMSAIGIEVPNKTVSFVYLRDLIDTDEFRSAKSKINAALGIDLTGKKMFVDIAKMPHLLIAGATGMGKSVCMNSLIVSLLYKATPDEVKFIFIDPKKVELNVYNGLPHLIVPVVSDPKKAAGALHWCVVEMERRYDILERTGKRNLSQYNEYCEKDPTAERLPQIVIVIDELADLMTTVRDEVEIPISRIAAKARAAGLHLIIGTQRPSVDVLTGTIKANIPSRIAFTTSSQIDSRTIIDTVGAEKLVGKGDMLYYPVGAMAPYRVQGAYVDEEEIEAIVRFIKENYGECSYNTAVAETIEKEAALCGKKGKSQGAVREDDGDDAEEEDPLLDSAIKIAVENQKIATSLLQRKLSVGYGRAAKLIDTMERRGIVGKPDGQKPRSVLITVEEYYEMQMRSSGSSEAQSEGEE